MYPLELHLHNESKKFETVKKSNREARNLWCKHIKQHFLIILLRAYTKMHQCLNLKSVLKKSSDYGYNVIEYTNFPKVIQTENLNKNGTYYA